MSLLSNGQLYFVPNYLSPEEADDLIAVLYDMNKFTQHKLYFYDDAHKKIVISNQRKSYWLGDYSQSIQDTDRVINDLGLTFTLPTDYAQAYHFPPQVITLKNRIERDYNTQFNSCLVGLYDLPTTKIGFHSDSSENLGDDPHIASISLGKTRNFKIKAKSRRIDEDLTLILNHGSLCMMRDGVNANYLHMVPPDPQCNTNNVRINLTFRNYVYNEEELKRPALNW